MKKIVPFKKDISFESNIAVINSISLEHFVDKKLSGVISGNFIISGDYKMSDTSTNLDPFEYELPFNINVDKKYKIEEATVDINDFYYEVINNKVLSVNIELLINNIEESVEDADNTTEEERCVDTTEEYPAKDVKNLFDNLDDNEEYMTYKVHIVTENDTVESIIQNYSVNRDLLNEYNDLSNVNKGDKIIIPTNESK